MEGWPRRLLETDAGVGGAAHGAGQRGLHGRRLSPSCASEPLRDAVKIVVVVDTVRIGRPGGPALRRGGG
jgi:hypothetical protein